MQRRTPTPSATPSPTLTLPPRPTLTSLPALPLYPIIDTSINIPYSYLQNICAGVNTYDGNNIYLYFNSLPGNIDTDVSYSITQVNINNNLNLQNTIEYTNIYTTNTNANAYGLLGLTTINNIVYSSFFDGNCIEILPNLTTNTLNLEEQPCINMTSLTINNSYYIAYTQFTTSNIITPIMLYNLSTNESTQLTQLSYASSITSINNFI